MKENLFEMGAKLDADSDNGWISDNKNKPAKKILNEIKTPEKHQLHFAKEKRRGKIVTIVRPFYLAKDDLQALLKSLKKRLGTGGTLKDESLEFQGDIPTQLRKHLENMGYQFKN